MTNAGVCKKWVELLKEGVYNKWFHSKNVSVRGLKFYSYSTVIARYDKSIDSIILTSKWYSRTTDKHKLRLRQAASKAKVEIMELDDEHFRDWRDEYE